MKSNLSILTSTLDEEWCRRTEHPIGLDENMQKLPLELYPEPEEGTEMHISDLIHKLANDGNVEVDFWIDDRFPFTGLDRRICRDCIFNKSITWEACKCDRLDKEEFRRRYIRHRCEYHKTTGTALSEYERKEKEIRDQKIKEVFPIEESLKIIRSFIQSRLDYDPHAQGRRRVLSDIRVHQELQILQPPSQPDAEHHRQLYHTSHGAGPLPGDI